MLPPQQVFDNALTLAESHSWGMAALGLLFLEASKGPKQEPKAVVTPPPGMHTQGDL